MVLMVRLPRPALSRPAALAAGCVSLAAIALAALTVLHDQLTQSASQVARGAPVPLILAVTAFGLGLLLSGLAWRAGLGAAGIPVSRTDAAARFAAGSLANSLLPFHLGTVLRLALFGHAAKDVRVVTGIATAIGSVGLLTMAALVATCAVVGPLPLWPAALLGGGAIVAALVSTVAARSSMRSHGLAAMTCGHQGFRVIAVALICSAYEVPNPILTGMAVVVALEIAGVLPLTPGNLGVSTAATSFALIAHGVPTTLALTVGIALPALETTTSIVVGLGAACYLTRVAGPHGRALTPRAQPTPAIAFDAG